MFPREGGRGRITGPNVPPAARSGETSTMTTWRLACPTRVNTSAGQDAKKRKSGRRSAARSDLMEPMALGKGPTSTPEIFAAQSFQVPIAPHLAGQRPSFSPVFKRLDGTLRKPIPYSIVSLADRRCYKICLKE